MLTNGSHYIRVLLNQQALQWTNSQSSKGENNTYVETSWRWQRFKHNLCKQGLVVNSEPVMSSCIKPIGHKIDYNGVEVLRGKSPPPPLPLGSPKVGHEWLASPWENKKYSWTPLIQTRLFRIPRYFELTPISLDLPFSHLLLAISNSRYFKLFFAFPDGSKVMPQVPKTMETVY